MTLELVPHHLMHHGFFVRCLVSSLGFIALGWGTVAFPMFLKQEPLEHITDRIIAGDPFKPGVLSKQFRMSTDFESSGYCHPSAIYSAAIVQLRMLEATTSADGRTSVDDRLSSLEHAIHNSLSCAPADPFLWLVLYALKMTKIGFRVEDLKYLRMSYQLGANEGWIALKRNPFIFAIYEKLPPDLQQNVINEFIALIKSKLYSQAADIFTGPAWPERNLILLNLIRIPDRDRQLFAKELSRRGFDVKMPSVPHEWPQL